MNVSGIFPVIIIDTNYEEIVRVMAKGDFGGNKWNKRSKTCDIHLQPRGSENKKTK